MAQKLIKITGGYTADGKELGVADVFPYLENPLDVILNGIKPLELASLTTRTDYNIIVEGDIDLGRWQPGKDEPIPDFSRVFIIGRFVGSKHIKSLPAATVELDLSKCGKDFVNDDLQMPEIVRIINFAYCIQSLDVLIGKITNKTTEIIVEPNLIKPSVLMQNATKMASAQRLAATYPNIKIYDTAKKYELHEVLADIARQKTTVVVDVNTGVKIQQDTPKTLDKIDGLHIDTKDIIDLCSKDVAFDEYDLNSDDFKRKIRFVLSNSPELDKMLMTREDGSVANCVNSAAWPIVRRGLIDILNAQKAGEKITDKQQPGKTETKTESVATTVTDTTTKTKEPLDIQKYISDSVLKQVKKSSGMDKLKNILMAINEINLDITDDFNYQGGAKIIKDGVLTVSSTVKKENGCVLVQSCDSNTSNDRKRLVWTVGDGPNGPVIVCMGFFEEHAETIKRYKVYGECLKTSSKRRSFSNKELSKYKNVSELLDTSTDVKLTPMKMLAEKLTKCK